MAINVGTRALNGRFLLWLCFKWNEVHFVPLIERWRATWIFFSRCKNCVCNESAHRMWTRAEEQKKKERKGTRAPMIKHVYRARKHFFPICWHTYSLKVAATNKAIKQTHKFHMCFCPFSFSLALSLLSWVHSARQFFGIVMCRRHIYDMQIDGNSIIVEKLIQ